MQPCSRTELLAVQRNGYEEFIVREYRLPGMLLIPPYAFKALHYPVWKREIHSLIQIETVIQS